MPDLTSATTSSATNSPPSQTSLSPPSPSPTSLVNLPTISADQLTIAADAPILGKGTFGTVYAAFLDCVHPVAVKVLRTSTMFTSPTNVPNIPLEAHHARIGARQFRREARRYSVLRSVSGIVRFYAIATTPQSTDIEMIVTERMSGGSLKDILKRNGAPLDELSTLRIATSIANALRELHRRQISHGDLKPGNVLFSERLEKYNGRVPENIQLKLVDFGLSRIFNNEQQIEEEEEDLKSCASWKSAPVDEKAASLMGGAEARGTPAYLSPEAWEGAQVLCKRSVAFRADIWALGMILYQLESGRAPWKGMGEWGIFVALCQHGDRPKWCGEERVNGLRNVVHMCWDGSDVEQVADELRALTDEMERNAREGGEIESVDSDVDDSIGQLTALTLANGATLRVGTTAAKPSRGRVVPAPAPAAGLPAPPAATTAATARQYAHHLQQQKKKSQSVPVISTSTLQHQLSPSPDAANMESASAGTSTSREQSGGLSLEEASVNGGYEPDYVSQPNGNSTQNTDNTTMSLPPPSGAVNIPQHVGSLDYAFKTEVMNNDCEGLVAAMERYERDPKQAVLVMDAVAVLLDNNDDNCVVVVERGGLRVMARILSRYGRSENRLCKSICVVILHLASCSRPVVESELRTTGACEMVLNSIRWHPTKLPVLQNAACAMNAMCRASTELCNIVLTLGGVGCALRVLSRSCTSFKLDVPVACAAFEVLGLVARDYCDHLIEGNSIEKILECCDSFRDERVDKHCLSILHYVTQIPEGHDKFLASTRGMEVFADVIRRIIVGGESATKLAMAYGIVSVLATIPKRGTARTCFLYSPIVERVVEGVEHVERDDTISAMGKTAVATAGLDCVRNMTTLGRDLCGSLQMVGVLKMCRMVVQNHRHERAVAERASLFLEQMLKELGQASFGADLDVVFDTLVQLEARWKHDVALIRRIRECIKMVQQRPSADPQQQQQQQPQSQQQQSQQPQAYSQVEHTAQGAKGRVFRVFMRKAPRRNR